MFYLNPGKIIRQLFPEQTKSVLSTIIWSIVFVLDIALVFWLAGLMGIHILTLSRKLYAVVLAAYLLAAFGLFSLQAMLYNKVVAGLR